MYIVNPSEKQYLLSHEKGEGIFCEILPPVLVMDGVEIRGRLEKAEAYEQSFRFDGITVADRVCRSDVALGVFRVTRTITNERTCPIRFLGVRFRTI